MQYTADAVHLKTKSVSAVQWAHSSLSRILLKPLPGRPNIALGKC